MKINLNSNNYIEKVKELVEFNDYKEIIKNSSIELEFVVGNQSKITLRNIIYLFQILNLDKSKTINSAFVVDKNSPLKEDEFIFIICNEKDKKDLSTNFKKISLNEILKTNV